MNVGIRKLMRRKGSVKGGYDGRSLTGRGSSFFWEGKHFGGEREYWFLGLAFLVLWQSSTVFEYHCRGHRVARGFGHGGQDIHMVSWSQEVVLVGRVETWFGQSWSVASRCARQVEAKGRSTRQAEGQHQTKVF